MSGKIKSTELHSEVNDKLNKINPIETEITNARTGGNPFNSLGERLDDFDNRFGVLLGEQVKGKGDQKYKLIAGVIRNDGTSWKFIEDSGHAKTGLSAISSSGNNIQIDYDFTATKVGSLIVTPDETLANYGITVGSSVGTAYSVINAYMPFSCFVTGRSTISGVPNPLTNSTSIVESGDLSGFTINHSTAFSGDTPVVSVVTESTQAPGLDVRFSFGTTSVICTAYADFHGYISCDGANFSVLTDNIQKPTLTWDAGTSQLVITHIPMNNIYDVQISGKDGLLEPRITSVAADKIYVKFFDWAGTAVTSLSTNMKLFYKRGVKVKNKMPGDMRVGIRRGSVVIPANDLVNASGNFWIYGIMEV